MSEIKRKIGAPSKYSPELGKEICEAVAASSAGLETVCRENPGFPNPKTVYDWIRKHEDFSKNYARAKHDQITVFISDIVDISRNASNDTIIDETTGKRISNPSAVQRSRLEIDTKKWLASKLAPKIYGGSLNADDVVTVDTADMKRRKDELDKKNKKDY